jgi:hypothetical protein
MDASASIGLDDAAGLDYIRSSAELPDGDFRSAGAERHLASRAAFAETVPLGNKSECPSPGKAAADHCPLGRTRLPELTEAVSESRSVCSV